MTQSGMRPLIVDRIEDGIAVLEGDHGLFELPAAWLPEGAGEGAVVQVEVTREVGSSRVALTLDRDARAAREAELRRLRDTIPEGPSGDLAL